VLDGLGQQESDVDVSTRSRSVSGK